VLMEVGSSGLDPPGRDRDGRKRVFERIQCDSAAAAAAVCTGAEAQVSFSVRVITIGF